MINIKVLNEILLSDNKIQIHLFLAFVDKLIFVCYREINENKKINNIKHSISLVNNKKIKTSFFLIFKISIRSLKSEM